MDLEHGSIVTTKSWVGICLPFLPGSAPPLDCSIRVSDCSIRVSRSFFNGIVQFAYFPTVKAL